MSIKGFYLEDKESFRPPDFFLEYYADNQGWELVFGDEPYVFSSSFSGEGDRTKDLDRLIEWMNAVKKDITKRGNVKGERND
jgi:hypothetical protein